MAFSAVEDDLETPAHPIRLALDIRLAGRSESVVPVLSPPFRMESPSSGLAARDRDNNFRGDGDEASVPTP